jgi:glucosylceramidase
MPCHQIFIFCSACALLLTNRCLDRRQSRWGEESASASAQNWARTVELWNIALNPNHGPHTGGCPDCLGVVTIDESTGNVTYSNDYYLLGHFSKFVVPEAYHIAANTLGSLSDVAFKNPDGSKVVVVHNGGSSSSTFKVRWNGAQSFAYTLPAGATVTFKWSGT